MIGKVKERRIGEMNVHKEWSNCNALKWSIWGMDQDIFAWHPCTDITKYEDRRYWYNPSLGLTYRTFHQLLYTYKLSRHTQDHIVGHLPLLHCRGRGHSQDETWWTSHHQSQRFERWRYPQDQDWLVRFSASSSTRRSRRTACYSVLKNHFG